MEPEEADALDSIFNANEKFRAIKQNLNEKVADALREERLLHYERKKNELTSDDIDKVPISIAGNSRKRKSPESRVTRSRKCVEKKTLESHTDVCTQPVTDVVSLTDSDDDVICEDPMISNLLDTSLDLNISESRDLTSELDDDEDDNCLVSVKVNWMNLNVHRFELRKHETFAIIFQELAEKENVPRDKILLILRDKIFITKEDTPESLSLSIIDIIEGGITKEIIREVTERKRTLDMLEFKCVLKDKKKPLLISIKKTDKMHCLMVKASEQLEFALEKLKFIFEGDELDSEATPIDLDLEGGEVIDVAIRKLLH